MHLHAVLRRRVERCWGGRIRGEAERKSYYGMQKREGNFLIVRFIF